VLIERSLALAERVYICQEQAITVGCESVGSGLWSTHAHADERMDPVDQTRRELSWSIGSSLSAGAV